MNFCKFEPQDDNLKSKELIKNLITKEWFPIIFWLVSIILLWLTLQFRNNFFDNFAIIIYTIGLLIILSTLIYQLIYKKWWQAVFSFLLLGLSITAFLFYFVALFFIAQSSSDPFAKKLIIPKDITIHEPLNIDFNENKPEKPSENDIDLQLYNSLQPGIYEYDFFIGKIEPGTIHLKAYEITKNYPLSTDRLALSTILKIENPTESIKKFSTNTTFTIYEGDWGDYYAARFEVWFKPENSNKERKLFSKNFKIEGWMR